MRSRKRPPGEARLQTRLRRARAAQHEVTLSVDWQRWVLENRLAGASGNELREALLGQGVPEAIAVRFLSQLESSPIYRTCRGLRHRRDQWAARCDVLATLRRAAPRVERLERVSGDEFFTRYYATNTPVVLTNMIRDWPAVKLWSPEYLALHHGDLPLQVMDRRNDNPLNDREYDKHRAETTLGEFARRVRSAPTTNDFYAVSRNENAYTEAWDALRKDVVPPPELFRDNPSRQAQSFWFGPKGTVTSLHHDPTNIFFCQIYGSKRFHLAPPTDTMLLRRGQGFFSSVRGVPDAKQLGVRQLYSLDLTAGEVLFIPALWWHHVEALSVSISYSLLHFRHQNRYRTYRP